MTGGADHCGGGKNGETGCARDDARFGARIGDGRDHHACIAQCGTCRVGGIVCGRYDDVRAGLDGVAAQIMTRGVGEHDPRTIIAGEYQRTFHRTGGDHHLLRPNVPEPLARETRIGFGDVVGDPFHQADHVVGEPAEGCGAWQERHVGLLTKRRERVVQPCGRGFAFDVACFSQQRSTELCLFIAEDDALATHGGSERC